MKQCPDCYKDLPDKATKCGCGWVDDKATSERYCTYIYNGERCDKIATTFLNGSRGTCWLHDNYWDTPKVARQRTEDYNRGALEPPPRKYTDKVIEDYIDENPQLKVIPRTERERQALVNKYLAKLKCR